MTYTRNILQQEFSRRKTKNRHYSLRAFAQALGIPAGRLSELLSGKRRATPLLATRISEKLKLDESQRRAWLEDLKVEKALLGSKSLPSSPQTDAKEFSTDDGRYLKLNSYFIEIPPGDWLQVKKKLEKLQVDLLVQLEKDFVSMVCGINIQIFTAKVDGYESAT